MAEKAFAGVFDGGCRTSTATTGAMTLWTLLLQREGSSPVRLCVLPKRSEMLPTSYRVCSAGLPIGPSLAYCLFLTQLAVLRTALLYTN
ncbi:hypothetical protein MRX96_051599 [Rhipicephalus microplus]